MNTKTQFLKTWCGVDLDAIAHNYNLTKKKTDAKVICVVKANAYGHGVIPVAKRLIDEGCDYFAVSSIEEAMEMRSAGIDCNILVLGYILPEKISEAVENDISFACASYEVAEILCKQSLGKKAKIHIKLNTGMNRTGFCVCHAEGYDDLKNALCILKKNDNVLIEGVFSHFAKAEDDKEVCDKQCSFFISAVDFIKQNGISPCMIHLCNSAGTYNYPSMHFDAVRVGVHLYGCEADEDFIPAMDFCTRIVDIHTLSEGDGVSYGLRYVADKETKVAVIGAGYADGVSRHLSDGNGYVLLHGKNCRILGRVCMDMTIIDVSDVPEAVVGDVVTIWGKGLPSENQAENAGTISYELLCSVSPRVPRVY